MPPVEAIFAAIADLLAPVAAVFGAIPAVLTPIEAVLEAIQRTTTEPRVAPVLGTVEPVFPTVDHVLPAVTAVLAAITDVFHAITDHGTAKRMLRKRGRRRDQQQCGAERGAIEPQANRLHDVILSFFGMPARVANGLAGETPPGQSR